jgi:hypothetical protein
VLCGRPVPHRWNFPQDWADLFDSNNHLGGSSRVRRMSVLPWAAAQLRRPVKLGGDGRSFLLGRASARLARPQADAAGRRPGGAAPYCYTSDVPAGGDQGVSRAHSVMPPPTALFEGTACRKLAPDDRRPRIHGAPLYGAAQEAVIVYAGQPMRKTRSDACAARGYCPGQIEARRVAANTRSDRVGFGGSPIASFRPIPSKARKPTACGLVVARDAHQ